MKSDRLKCNRPGGALSIGDKADTLWGDLPQVLPATGYSKSWENAIDQ
jgi:hypothetical protein